MDEQKYHETRLVYMGRRLNGRGGLAYQYQVGDSEDVWTFAKNLWPGAQVGTVLLVNATAEGSVSRAGMRVTGAYDLKGPAALWAAQEAADVTMSEREALSKRNARGVEPPLEDALRTLRVAYLGLSGVGRKAAFIDWVSAAIQGVK